MIDLDGAISFGMVTIPVKLYTATEQKDVRFRLLIEKRFCTADGKEVAWDDLVRRFEVSKGEYVVLDPDEIEAARPESAAPSRSATSSSRSHVPEHHT